MNNLYNAHTPHGQLALLLFEHLSAWALKNYNDKATKVYYGKELFVVCLTMGEPDFKGEESIGGIMVFRGKCETTRKNTANITVRPNQWIYRSGYVYDQQRHFCESIQFYEQDLSLPIRGYKIGWFLLPKEFDFKREFGVEVEFKSRKPRSDRGKSNAKHLRTS